MRCVSKGMLTAFLGCSLAVLAIGAERQFDSEAEKAPASDEVEESLNSDQH